MHFVDITKFRTLPEHVQAGLLQSNVLPVTPVTLWTWQAINAINPDGSRKYKYIIGRGSSRSGKTFGYIDCFDRYCREEMNKRCTVWRDTKTDCKKTVLNDARRHLRSTGRYKVNQDFNKTESIFTYDTSSTFEIHGTDDEETVHGLTQSAAWLNEPYKISKDVFDQIDQRTEDFMLIDLNPKMGHWSEDLSKDSRAIVIHSTFNDNPLCPEESRYKILSYQPVSMCETVTVTGLSITEANEYSVTDNERGLTDAQIEELSRCRENERKNSASEYQWSVYGLGLKAEQPNRIFKWHEIPDHVYHALQVTTFTGVDWGAVDPWGIVDAKYYDGALYLHERNYTSENVLRGTLRPTELEQINASEEGIVKWMFKRLAIPVDRYVACDTNRPLKILALREAGWEYAVAAIKPQGSVIDGIDSLNNIKVYYTASSTNLKYEQENYSRKVDRYGIVLEEPEDTNNHLIDPTRYIYQLLQHLGIIKKL